MSGTGSSDVRRAYPGPQDQYPAGGGGYVQQNRGMPRSEIERGGGRGLPPAADPYQQRGGAPVDSRRTSSDRYGRGPGPGMYQQEAQMGRGGQSGQGRQGGQQMGGASGAHQVATTTGQFRSGHIEVDSLYGSGDNKGLTVNAMNAPNNSTMQCGCENIDCPFCNQMMSIQMSDQY